MIFRRATRAEGDFLHLDNLQPSQHHLYTFTFALTTQFLDGDPITPLFCMMNNLIDLNSESALQSLTATLLTLNLFQLSVLK